MCTRFLSAIVLLIVAAPAAAQASAQVPEGSNFTLFGLGILGILIGRHASRKRKRRD